MPAACTTNTPFEPDPPLDPSSLRRAFGHFATGVAIVTAQAADGIPVGMTINSLASLSLEPALLLWSIATSSRSHAAFSEQALHFAVHVLGSEQRQLCHTFHDRLADRFANIPWSRNQHGVPLLPDCLVRFECERFQTVAAGDHTILIGQIQRVTETPGEPLLFHRGSFGGFQAA